MENRWVVVGRRYHDFERKCGVEKLIVVWEVSDVCAPGSGEWVDVLKVVPSLWNRGRASHAVHCIPLFASDVQMSKFSRGGLVPKSREKIHEAAQKLPYF